MEVDPSRSRAASDDGVVAVVTALLAVIIFMFAAIAVDVARWYSEAERIQRAVDAASLAGVPYLPAFPAKAYETARANLQLNGLTAAEAAAAEVTQDADKRSRLIVTAESVVPNIFATVAGFDFKTITRTATADYAADASMGSPCNVMGNEPPDADGLRVASGACPPAPNFWDNIAGPDAPKGNGDRFTTRTCAAGTSNCSSGVNVDYFGGTTSGGEVPGQSYYIYKITPSAPVTMQLQLFDPMFIDVGDYCERGGKLKKTTNGLWDGALDPNPFVDDADVRYAWGSLSTSPSTPGTFCTGDILFERDSNPTQAEDLANAQKLNTTFALINPTPKFNPLQSSIICRETFGGFSGDLTKALVESPDDGYDSIVARHFRQWVDMPCSISVPAANVGKDYYLMVRTNVLPGADDSEFLDPAEDPNARGSGHNRYGIRVKVSGGSSSDVAISARERMPIYANVKSGTTNFHLARVSSGNAGSEMTVEFFDTGDASSASGTSIGIIDPSGDHPSGCSPAGEVVPDSRPGDFNASICGLDNVWSNNGYNGKIQRLKVPIPDDYTCDDEDPESCWYTVDFTYGSNVVANDTTTWSVSLDGDPVRLVK